MSNYIFLQVPHLGEPTATFCAAEDILGWLNQDPNYYVLSASPAQMLHDYGYETLEEAREDDEGGIADQIEALIERFGADTRLHAAYADGEEPEWQAEPLDLLEVAMARAGHDLSYGRCIPLAEVKKEIECLRGPHAPRIGKCGPRAAAAALEAEARRYSFYDELEWAA
ncbi:MAG: hypothetical protein H3C28_15295 [Sphingomonadales bacterium]|nr:hypothetical protein [Sphingomonadales bacterium]